MIVVVSLGNIPGNKLHSREHSADTDMRNGRDVNAAN